MTESLTFHLPDEASTRKLGRELAKIAQTGDVFALYGTLGMGKSVLARAFVQELTAAAEVPSPTFTLMQIYDAPSFEIYHFDLYRLKSPDEIFEIGVEEAMYSGVCLIEWPERMTPYLPRDIFKVELLPEGSGRLAVITPGSPAKSARLQNLGELL